jgi:hypothetical protein
MLAVDPALETKLQGCARATSPLRSMMSKSKESSRKRVGKWFHGFFAAAWWVAGVLLVSEGLGAADLESEAFQGLWWR